MNKAYIRSQSETLYDRLNRRKMTASEAVEEIIQFAYVQRAEAWGSGMTAGFDAATSVARLAITRAA